MDFYIAPKIPQTGTATTNPQPPIKHHKSTSAPPEEVTSYKECLRNHAASIGGHALDGCGEFMPSPTAVPTNPTSLTCAACDCHRNFHRRVTEDQSPPLNAQPLRVSSTSAPHHMLLALRSGGSSGPLDWNEDRTVERKKQKRVRTRFSQEQKEKMYGVSEKLGWRLCKEDEGLVEDFCNEVGIGKSVLKVWMHNNKYTFGKVKRNDVSANTDTNNGHHQIHHGNNNVVNGYNRNLNNEVAGNNAADLQDGSSSSF